MKPEGILNEFVRHVSQSASADSILQTTSEQLQRLSDDQFNCLRAALADHAAEDSRMREMQRLASGREVPRFASMEVRAGRPVPSVLTTIEGAVFVRQLSSCIGEEDLRRNPLEQESSDNCTL